MDDISEDVLGKGTGTDDCNEIDGSNAEIELNQDQSEMNQNEAFQVDMESGGTNGKELSTSKDALLGTQKLVEFESASEDDAEDVRISLTKKTKRIVDSENEDNDDIQLNDVGDETTMPKPLIDNVDEGAELKLESDGKENNQQRRNCMLGSIDSESEIGLKEKCPNKISTLIDSDSQEENESSPEMQLKKKTTFLKRKSQFHGLVDTDSEENENTQEDTLKSNGSKMSSNVIDSDTNSGQSGDETLNAQHEAKGKDETKPPMRSSAKKAIDHMQAIQSEQQRLHREAHISIPYHKPKRHTLQEFLKRRTIQKSQLNSEGSATGRSSTEGKRLKMTAEELEEYAKLMEERAKEAAEFFKSESDDDEPKHSSEHNNSSDCNNSVLKNFEPQTDVDAELVLELEKPNQPQTDVNAELLLELEKPNELIIEENSEKLSAEKCISNEDEETEPILTFQPIVTEVIELPKLDISTLQVAPPTTAEKVIRLINQKQLPDSPSIRGDPNMMIDLETGDLVVQKSTGVDNLLKRFMAAKAQRKPKTSETLSILSTENGKLEISNINVHITDDSIPTKEPKPRAAYFKLKENLRSIITKKRLEELEKKKAEKRDEEEEYGKCLGEEELEDGSESDTKNKNVMTDDEENAIDDEENAIDDEENAIDDEENAIDDEYASDNVEEPLDDNEDNTSDKEGVIKFLALESNIEKSTIDINKDNKESESSYKVEDDDDDENTDDDDNDDDVENKSDFKTLDCPKKKNRIIKAFQEDSDEENDFLRTPSDAEYNSVKLFGLDKANISPTEEENELLKLCSGTQQTSAKSFISQIPVTQANINLQADADDELLELCSGTFDAQPDATPTEVIAADDFINDSINLPTSPKFITKILSSDEEEKQLNVDNKEGNTERVKKFTKRVKKNKVKLGFSDDEDEETAAAAKEDEISDNEENVPETFVDYDSEENEIVVQMTKEDCVMQAEKFFEKEAELSDSEWGSADEDERNLDKYEIELGDEDEFDRAELQTELGKIHARKMLDEDIREVRLIQEMLFDDEENDGVGRQRQFKWKNMESGFSLNDPNGGGENDEKGESEDEENEQLWRKIRYERDQLLREQATKEDVSVTSILNSTHSTSIIGNSTLQAAGGIKKLNIITAKTATSVESKKSSFLIPNNKANDKSDKKPVRGSFLERDKETLIKLVSLTKDAAGTAGTVSVKEVKPQNFVFATLTEEEHAQKLKRKSDDLLNSSAENGINFMKKPKLEPRRTKCFIDQLL